MDQPGKYLILLFIILYSCTNKKGHVMENNFNVELEGFGYADKINLKEDRLIRVYNDSTSVVKINLDSTDRAMIFDIVVDNDLLSLPDYYAPEAHCDALPIFGNQMVVTNGGLKKTIQISWCDYSIWHYFKAKRIKESILGIENVVGKKEAVKKLPRTDTIVY
jgi:hypothetical protein